VRLRIVTAILGISGAAVLVAGCSSVGGTPAPTASPVSSTSSTVTAQGAPKVKTPVDTTKFQASPCTTLTAAQARPFTIVKPGSADVGTTALGPGCSWSNSDNGTVFAVQFITANKIGLSALYANKDILESGGGYFEPTAVQDYPAVFNSSADQRKQGTCGLAVAVSDSLDYSVSVALASFAPKYSDPCGMATQVAGLVMTNLHGGS
jgi:Protein of unknown function (DUF3558)